MKKVVGQQYSPRPVGWSARLLLTWSALDIHKRHGRQWKAAGWHCYTQEQLLSFKIWSRAEMASQFKLSSNSGLESVNRIQKKFRRFILWGEFRLLFKVESRSWRLRWQVTEQDVIGEWQFKVELGSSFLGFSNLKSSDFREYSLINLYILLENML